MIRFPFLLAGVALGLVVLRPVGASEPVASLQLPPVGFSGLRVPAPALLELELVTTKSAEGPVAQWNFVDNRGQCSLPKSQDILVRSGGKPISVKSLGFRRRVLYAPLKHRELRIDNYLYVELTRPTGENEDIEVLNPGKNLWLPKTQFRCKTDPLGWSPVLHVNQTGYMPSETKKAMVGYYLGTLGEMDVQQALISAASLNNSNALTRPISFEIIEVTNARTVFTGKLLPRPDRGFPFPSYQRVLEADFTALQKAGQYQLRVDGLGTSFPFWIHDGVAGALARTYALGIYHQRCGTSNGLPFTRFTHGSCHTAPAEVPTLSPRFQASNDSLAKESANFKDNPRHTAPQLRNVTASLYPFVNKGPVDVSGGHHDAGDYSKYTINSAGFIHHLVFAADVFPGVSGLDNLGLPESGDGKSDILQEAKWEADFLAKMQDSDGGFYFLVYPRNREYESDVMPDHGDPQVVFPKTTSVTAAATAALAQCASSAGFKKQYPDASRQYLEKAKKGWAFLEAAISRYGKDGAYQKITHYGDEFMHDDELAWAACEMYLATGEPEYHKKLMDWFNPADPNTRRWGWWRAYDSYGCALRSYAFAARTGRLSRDRLNSLFLEQCENELAAAGEDQLRRSEASAYATSFPEEAKRTLSAGWYFSGDAAFDLAVALQLDYPLRRDPRPRMREALLGNLNYEQGCNPVNVVYLTGLGWKRQHEIVHQFALNSRQMLPPTGIPLGNISEGFGWNFVYEKELGTLSFPQDGTRENPYPFYDRWGDGFNLSQEFVVLNQARALGYLAWLFAQSPLKDQAWRSAPGTINGVGAKSSPGTELHLTLNSPGINLGSALIVWETSAPQQVISPTFDLKIPIQGLEWIEAEAQMPDGRRVFAVWNLH
jgi:hypothetical protein